jgi:hypothetical protein
MITRSKLFINFGTGSKVCFGTRSKVILIFVIFSTRLKV